VSAHEQVGERMPTTAAQPAGQGDVLRASPRIQYRPPRLRELGCAADLLEMLGPAQANYGGPNVL
jgi:hypothetical protein